MWTHHDWAGNSSFSYYIFFHSGGEGWLSIEYTDYDNDENSEETEADITWKSENDKVILTVKETGNEFATLELTDKNNGYLKYGDSELKMERYVSDDDDDDY